MLQENERASSQSSQIIRVSEVNSQYQRSEAEEAGQYTKKGLYQADKHDQAGWNVFWRVNRQSGKLVVKKGGGPGENYQDEMMRWSKDDGNDYETENG